jgi:signal transduction histidine kinase
MPSASDPLLDAVSREEPQVLLNRKRQPSPSDLQQCAEPEVEMALSDLMHDLRSPLTAIASTLFLLRREMGEVEGKVQRYLDLLDRQVGRLEGVLHDFEGR